MCFFECTSLTTVTIPDSVTHIRDFAFYDCKLLANIDFPDSVTYIGNNAFDKCISFGVDATHFNPTGKCTRGHAVTFLYRGRDLLKK